MFTSILNESILGLQPIFRSATAWLVGAMALSLLLAWRWRWRDYLLPWKINRRLRRGENIQDVPAPAMGAQEGISALPALCRVRVWLFRVAIRQTRYGKSASVFESGFVGV